MALTERDYLHIHKGEDTYLLLRADSHYCFIWIDAKWSESAFHKLLRIYPCSEETLRKHGYRASAFKAETLRYVITRGTKTDDELELWVGADLRQYTFGSDYTQEFLDSFFTGARVHHHQPEQWNGLPMPTIHKIAWGLNGFSILLAFVFSFWGEPSRLLAVLCILCQLVAIALPMFFRESFTLEEETFKTYGAKPKCRPGKLWPALVAPAIAMTLNMLENFTMEGRYLFVMMGIMLLVEVAAFIGGLVNSIRVRTTPVNYVLLALLLMIFSSGTVGQLNYVLDFHDKPSYEAQVLDKRQYRGSNSTSYYCTVELPNGEHKEFSVRRSIYEQTEIGEEVLITDYAGAFGIPFSTLETIEED